MRLLASKKGAFFTIIIRFTRSSWAEGVRDARRHYRELLVAVDGWLCGHKNLLKWHASVHICICMSGGFPTPPPPQRQPKFLFVREMCGSFEFITSLLRYFSTREGYLAAACGIYKKKDEPRPPRTPKMRKLAARRSPLSKYKTKVIN